MTRVRPRFRLWLVLVSLVALVGACGASSDGVEDSSNEPGASDVSSDSGVRVVSVDDAANTLENPPDGLVVLDVRTPEEFDEARLTDATMIDFYEADFADQIADLDRDAPYLLYCRSGNRSGQTRTLMEQLGFTNVADVDGGINAWQGDGQPVVTGP